MENSDKCCGKCKNFDCFYTRGIKRFNKTKVGWCRVICDTIYAEESCERFACRNKTKNIKSTVQKCLNDLLIELTEIRKVVEEELDECE